MKTYRDGELDRLDSVIFERICAQFARAGGDRVLDAGCGSCEKSVLLAGSGFQVTAVDTSDWVLERGRERVEKAGLSSRVTVLSEDLTRLTLADSSFDHAVACGVLMHIPDLELALRELVRVLRPGGLLGISEICLFSPESRLDIWLRRIFRMGTSRLVTTKWGVEFWTERPEGTLCTRRLDVDYLLGQASALGLLLVERRATLTEFYARVRWLWLKRLLLRLNRFYFQRALWPHLGFGNVLIFRKHPSTASE